MADLAGLGEPACRCFPDRRQVRLCCERGWKLETPSPRPQRPGRGDSTNPGSHPCGEILAGRKTPCDNSRVRRQPARYLGLRPQGADPETDHRLTGRRTSPRKLREPSAGRLSVLRPDTNLQLPLRTGQYQGRSFSSGDRVSSWWTPMGTCEQLVPEPTILRKPWLRSDRAQLPWVDRLRP